MNIKFIKEGSNTMGIIIPYGYCRDDGNSIEFLTHKDESLQLGYMVRPAGHQVEPHRHKALTRSTISVAQEVLFIRSGVVQVTFYGEFGNEIEAHTLAAGDVVMFVGGGHGLRVINNAQIVEVKQGPYTGQDKAPITRPATAERTV